MFSILGAALFALITPVTLLAACGLPLGELTMGGRHRILPTPFRVAAILSLFAQLFAGVIILQAGSHIAMWFSAGVTKVICLLFAGYLSLNTIMNLLSRSKKEKYIMTPLSLVAAACFWIVGLQL